MSIADTDLPDFPVIVSQDNGAFTLRIPKLHLIEVNADLETAYKNINTRKSELLLEYSKAGCLDELVSTSETSATSDATQNALKVFAIKSGLVALAGVIIVCAAAFTISYSLKTTTRKAALKMGRSAIAQVEKGLQDAAQAELTPEKKAKIQMLLSDAVPHLRPFIRELRPLFVDFCPPAG